MYPFRGGKWMASFAFLILNYNTYNETVCCVKSIENLKKEPEDEIKIVIVDNDSTDQSLNSLRELYKEKEYIYIIHSNYNGGFSSGNNIGYKYINDNLNCDFLLMINSDIEFRQNNIFNIIKKIYAETDFSVLGPDVYAFHMGIHQSPIRKDLPNLEKQQAEVASSKLLLKKYREMDKQGKKYVSFLNKKIIDELVYKYGKKMHLDKLRKNALHYDRKYQDVMIHGSAMIFSKKYLDKYVHALYPEPFYYGEEDLLFLKCMKNGDKIVYDPSVRVWHAAGASASNTKGKRYTLKREIFRYENLIKSKEMLIEIMKQENYFDKEIKGNFK